MGLFFAYSSSYDIKAEYFKVLFLMVILTRWFFSDECTLGRLEFDGFRCWTVEKPWLDNAVNVSCVPDGKYQMVRHDSPKFGPDVWMLEDVPERSYILIHAGNTAKDVTGCIALGEGLRADADGVTSSRKALSAFEKLTGGLDSLKIQIITGRIAERS